MNARAAGGRGGLWGGAVLSRVLSGDDEAGSPEPEAPYCSGGMGAGLTSRGQGRVAAATYLVQGQGMQGWKVCNVYIKKI